MRIYAERETTLEETERKIAPFLSQLPLTFLKSTPKRTGRHLSPFVLLLLLKGCELPAGWHWFTNPAARREHSLIPTRPPYIHTPNPKPEPLTHKPYGNVQRIRGGLVFKAHRLVYHSTLCLGVIKKKKLNTSPPRNRFTLPGSLRQDP